MKIVPSSPIHPAESRAALRANPAASFAELMEGGIRARTLLSHRALGFSETGLLGLHFAPPLGAKAPAVPAAAPLLQPEGAALDPGGLSGSPGAALSRSNAASQSNRTGRPAPALTADGAPARRTPPDLSLRPAGGARLGAMGLAAPVLPEATPAARSVVPPTAPVPPAGRRPSLQVRVFGDGPGLAVVVDGNLSGDESILELEATAQAIASEYGLHIGRLLVRPNGRGAGG